MFPSNQSHNDNDVEIAGGKMWLYGKIWPTTGGELNHRGMIDDSASMEGDDDSFSLLSGQKISQPIIGSGQGFEVKQQMCFLLRIGKDYQMEWQKIVGGLELRWCEAFSFSNRLGGKCVRMEKNVTGNQFFINWRGVAMRNAIDIGYINWNGLWAVSNEKSHW